MLVTDPEREKPQWVLSFCFIRIMKLKLAKF